MNANKTGGAETKRGRGFSILLVVQLLLAAAAVAVMVVVGKEIKPLFEQRQQLKDEIEQLQARRLDHEARLDSLQNKIDASIDQLDKRNYELAQRSLTSAKEEVVQARARISEPIKISHRVVIHIRDESQREVAGKIGAELRSAGYVVPDIELVNAGPDATELRFLRKAEQEEAAKIVGLLEKKMRIQARLADHSATYENAKDVRPGTYELWLAPKEFEEQLKK